MRTILRSLALTTAVVFGMAAAAQNVVTITGYVTPCGGVIYPVHIVTNTVPPIDTTIYTSSNCWYSLTINPVETNGTVAVSTSCDGGITWVNATGTWSPFFPVVNIDLACNGGSGVVNDECYNASYIVPGASCTPMAGTLVDATESFPPNECAGFVSTTANDVWYRFYATGTTSTVQATGDGDLDVVLEVFIDSCSAAGAIGCSDNTFDGGLEEFTFATTPGQPYFYRIYEFTPGTPATTYTFSTCVIGNNSLFDCEGVEGGNAMPGTPCDDGNPNTLNDTWTPTCYCTGAFIPPCNACFTSLSNQPWVIELTNCTNGGTAPYTYAWTFSDGSASSAASPTWTVVVEGEYIACLTIADINGCTSTTCDTFYVDANGGVSTGFVPCTACIDVVPATDGPAGPLLPWTVFANNCSTGGPSQYTYNISWGDGVDNGPNPHVYAGPGSYMVCITMTSSNGCTSVACDSVVVDVDGTIDPVAPCQAAFWVMQAYEVDSLNPNVGQPIPNELWVWNLSTPGSSNVTLNMTTTAGSNIATVAAGCDALQVGMQVSGPNIPAGTAIAGVFCPNISLSINATATGTAAYSFTGNTGNFQFVWSWGDGTPDSTDPYPTHFYANGGPYNLCLTVYVGGCTDTSCDSVSVDDNGIYTGMILEENYARSGFTIRVLNQMPTSIADRPAFENTAVWPNPVEDMLNLTFNTTLNGNVPMSIIDLNGRVASSTNIRIATGGNRVEVPVADLAQGMYLLRFGNDENAVSFRFVKR